MQLLRGRVNDLKATKIKMCTDLQKKSSLIEQLETINKENAHLLETVKVIRQFSFFLTAFLNKAYFHAYHRKNKGSE